MNLKQTAILMLCNAITFAPIVTADQKQEPARQGTKQPAAVINRYGFFQSQTYQVEPQIEAILLLTGEQKKKLQQISDSSTTPIALQEAQRRREERKAGVKPTPQERKAATINLALQMIEAVREVRKQSEVVLTAEQKAIIQTVDAAIKNNPASKLENLLGPEQFKALREAQA